MSDAVPAVPERIPRDRLALYALGTAGWTIPDRVVTTFALFYYLPPAGRGLPARLEEGAFLGITVFGLVMILGRIVDSLADPLVAAWSDRSRSPLGRRRAFLLGGALPLAALTAAIFFPPAAGPAPANAVFLAVALGAFFLCFTVYVVPYLALIPELARDRAERIHLTTRQAFAQLGGAAVVMIAAPVMVSALGGGAGAYQRAITATCVIAALLMLLPALAVDERRFARPVAEGQPGLAASLRLTLSHRAFRWYLGGNIAYWFAFNIVSAAALYFTTVLMRAEEGFQGAALAATFAVAGVCFLLWNVLGRRLGQRAALLWAGVAFVVALVAMAFIRDPAGGVLAFALAGVPVGAILVLPNAALAECAEDDARRTGTRREAMFFGAQGFLMKVNLGLSTAVLAGLMALFGREAGDDLGVRLAGPVAAAVVLLGMWSFWKYPERDLLAAPAGSPPG